MQRPFVWNSTKVRDLLDSLYKGFPVGYLITWQSTGVAMRGGGVSTHHQILIDGQQRVTALTAAIAGRAVMNKNYKLGRIRIAFNPQTERFETSTPIIARDPAWVADVFEVFSAPSVMKFVREYLEANADVDEGIIERGSTDSWRSSMRR